MSDSSEEFGNARYVDLIVHRTDGSKISFEQRNELNQNIDMWGALIPDCKATGNLAIPSILIRILGPSQRTVNAVERYLKRNEYLIVERVVYPDVSPS